ncbi:hypothetical protein SLEP1_g21563 [Rubroshorea leprosula]|uniref:DUF4283 domain-containing protein n=1 Tax=Rubroshorea leprosula TaxID=152421 RepID=A0AAV5JCF9_9ROSI|nr:hypothetical protein SLEP1_g21563 [Rubroshorea leprosula]
MRGRSRVREKLRFMRDDQVRAKDRWTAWNRVKSEYQRLDKHFQEKIDSEWWRNKSFGGFDRGMYNQAKAFFFSNFLDDWNFEQKWQTFKKYGKVLEIHCPNRRGKTKKGSGVFSCHVRAMGGKLILLDSEDKEELRDLINLGQDWLGQWFKEIREWSPSMVATKRFVWLKFQGVPLNSWNSVFFATVANLWGKFITLDENFHKTPCSEDDEEEKEGESWAANSDFGEIQGVANVKDVQNEDYKVAAKDWIEERQSVIQNLKQIHGNINVTSKSNDGQSKGQQIIHIEKVNREKSVEMEVDSFKIVNENAGNENDSVNSSPEDARMIGGSNEMVEQSSSNQRVKEKIRSNESKEKIQKIHELIKYMGRGPIEKGRTDNAEGEASMDGVLLIVRMSKPKKSKEESWVSNR